MVIAPVKVAQAGIYVGDVHAMMGGDGEAAGRTTDVSADVIIEATVIKGLAIDGTIVLPRRENLPLPARPYVDEKRIRRPGFAGITASRLKRTRIRSMWWVPVRT